MPLFCAKRKKLAKQAPFWREAPKEENISPKNGLEKAIFGGQSGLVNTRKRPAKTPKAFLRERLEFTPKNSSPKESRDKKCLSPSNFPRSGKIISRAKREKEKRAFSPSKKGPKALFAPRGARLCREAAIKSASLPHFQSEALKIFARSAKKKKRQKTASLPHLRPKA